MNNIWITSDHHLGHANIIKYCDRPFDSVEEMDEVLIQAWNERVKPGDTVYHLGDFAFTSRERVKELANILNGGIHWIFGNHDTRNRRQAEGFAWKGWYKEITVPYEGRKQKIILFHYAQKVWNKSHHGSWHLYGHSHGTLPTDYSVKAFDIGVDCHDYKPLSIEEIGELMKQHDCVPVDHHDARTT